MFRVLDNHAPGRGADERVVRERFDGLEELLMTSTKIELTILYDDKLEMPEAAELMMRIKGALGERPVSGFNFDR